MTPMPTAAVPCMMEYGGYGQKDLIRGGWLFAVLYCVSRQRKMIMVPAATTSTVSGAE